MRVLFYCFLLTLGQGFLTAQVPELPRTIVLVADEWAPYNMEPGTAPEGYIIDIAREVFGERNITVEYRIVPWARAVQDTKSGIYDGIVGASIADAPGFVFPTEPLAINTLGFFTLPSSTWKFTGEKSLDLISLGVIKGYDYRPWLSRYVEQNKNNPSRVQVMVGNTPLETNLRKLLEGKVGAVVDSQTAILYTAKSLKVAPPLRLAGVDSEPASIHVAFSPAKQASAALAEILSTGIASLRKSGRLAVLLSRYGLTDWKP